MIRTIKKVHFLNSKVDITNPFIVYSIPFDYNKDINYNTWTFNIHILICTITIILMIIN